MRSTKVDALNPILFYQNRNGGNLLEKENLIKIKNIEDKIRNHKNWDKICLAQSEEDLSCHQTEAFITPLIFL